VPIGSRGLHPLIVKRNGTRKRGCTLDKRSLKGDLLGPKKKRWNEKRRSRRVSIYLS